MDVNGIEIMDTYRHTKSHSGLCVKNVCYFWLFRLFTGFLKI